MTRMRLLSAGLLLALLLAACGGGDTAQEAPESASESESESESEAASESGVEGDVLVFAAASLTDAFNELGSTFTEDNPDATVTFNFASSSQLATQITEGAPADVFASADTANMDKLVEAGLNGDEPEIFATNLLTIIVAPDNPLGIAGVEDLANTDILTAICAAEVPCGRYANEIFTNAGITVTPVSLEQNVRGVVTKVTAGEADAGIVYETDVLAAGDEASGVEIPEDINVLAEYAIASVGESQNVEVADAFIEFVNGEEAQAILEEYGFGAP